ncbi:DUF4192 domain-containing protein [Nocardia alni]|uniref:DUF4192 domain-containing protein n=1 Tax=Nocardia alni TaxID=2815723 RepID=UPI001C22D463|nr:DUF4192 domain-containing protein [Nocardia alni]
MGSVPKITVGSLSDLFAAVPAMLGFYPQDSVTVVTSHRRSSAQVVGAVLSRDLAGCLEPEGDALHEAVQYCIDSDAVAVNVFVVDAQAQPDDSASAAERGRQYRGFIARLAAAFTSTGIRIDQVCCTTALAAGSPWWSLINDEHGTLPDPATSPVAAHTAARSFPTSRELDDLVTMLAPDRSLAERVRGYLAEAIRAAERAHTAGMAVGDPDAYARRAITTVASYVDSGQALHANQLADITVALSDPTVRDCMLGLAESTDITGVQAFWARLAAALPAPERARPAAVLAFIAYFHGRVPVARAAVIAALESDPGYTLARLMETVVAVGLPFSNLNSSVAHARAIATALEVTLPGRSDH